MPRPSSRDRILDALERILVETGLHAVTLESVAEKAGVSKGGLLYHFPSKEALITGLARRLAEGVEEEFEQAVASDDVVDFFLRTSVPTSSDGPVYWSLLAALRSNDVASEEARGLVIYCFVRWAEILREHVKDPVTAEIVRLVGDGLYLSALAGLPMPDPALLDEVRHRLTREAGATKASD
ncbi:TetR/AcrR family transcriptional regulator [Jiangella rhizosphaerae]|uniref:TetR/AcrR family transcriptional regulator n=1 Tax=Jiangella rhizosphaerae TaxID=2293569 RepID=A0A418KUF5_9ACTN|nr:TetR/AcrR family transcriptional regulator [Jiangella rhizosphaerae]RIQ30210.1 TetR/AcrR family transcriptional regulator [Jiangella rhizosphaerae]